MNLQPRPAPLAETALLAQADERAMPGASPADKVGQVLSLLGGIAQVVRPGQRVLLKPNWVAPFPHATTDLALIAAVAEQVRAAGGEPFLAESSGFEFDTAATFALLGLEEWAAGLGLPLQNLDEGPFETVPAEIRPFDRLEIARCALEADVVINLPRMKRHSYTRVTLGMKNLMGLLSRASRRELHTRGLERGIVALARLVRPALTILDGLVTTSRAVYGVTEERGIVVGGRDVVALDHYGCRLLGVEPYAIEHIWRGASAGVGTMSYRVAGAQVHPAIVLDNAQGGGPSLYRAGFRALFAADRLYARWSGGRSLLPWAHYYLGVRPRIDPARCTRCGACAAACPAAAIDVAAAKVVAERCMRVRCLRCVEACPERAIEVRGLRAGKRRG
ncbi:MAG: DUF362 domain-containing protein [Chloroflexi bacterium]|nr:DUF362 domain-containing protein [Chloroflexota bacterium]